MELSNIYEEKDPEVTVFIRNFCGGLQLNNMLHKRDGKGAKSKGKGQKRRSGERTALYGAKLSTANLRFCNKHRDKISPKTPSTDTALRVTGRNEKKHRDEMRSNTRVSLLVLCLTCLGYLASFASAQNGVHLRFVNAQVAYSDPLLLQYLEYSYTGLFTTTTTSPDFTDFDIVLLPDSQTTFNVIDIYSGVSDLSFLSFFVSFFYFSLTGTSLLLL